MATAGLACPDSAQTDMELPIKLISTDFDGTLFSEFESVPVPVPLQDLLGQLQAQGAKWVINTGREMSSLLEALARARINVEPDYLVLVEREIHAREGSRYSGLEDWNQRCAGAHAEVFSRMRHDLPRLVAWVQARFHVRIYEDPYSPFCLIARNNGDADAIHEYLADYCRTVPQLTLVRNDVYARFSHEAFNKGTALAEVARRLGLSPGQVFAIGDHLNDLPMLSPGYARFLAAPANAVPVVKQAVLLAGGYLSSASHGWGVMEALQFYLPQRAENLPGARALGTS